MEEPGACGVTRNDPRQESLTPLVPAGSAQAAVFAWPLRLEDIEPLMNRRIEALLAAGKHQEALAAKGEV